MDGLGLSLSLNLPESSNINPSLLPCIFPVHNIIKNKILWNEAFCSKSDGIDVNRVPWETDYWEDEYGVSSPNSTISSVSLKRCDRATNGEDNCIQRVCSRSMSDEEEDVDGSRKKLRLSKDQSAVLEDCFKDQSTLNPIQKMLLAKRLNLRPRQVEVWFQNRRARTKLKQTEVDCEIMKRCCEDLTVENRRLKKELNELRALKFSPSAYMKMAPPTTLSMCPSCERLSGPSSSAQQGPINHWASYSSLRS